VAPVTVPAVYALGMGVAAVFNPCGVALLPAIFAWVGGTTTTGQGSWMRAWRGLQVGILMALGFTLVVAGLGVMVRLVGVLVARILPTAMIGLGALLVVGGVAVAMGLFHFPVDRWVKLEGVAAGRPRHWAFLVAGLTYGVGALSCTLPLFVAALLPTMSGGWAPFVAMVVLFGLGSAAVLVAVSEATLFVRDGLLRVLRSVAPWLNPGLGAVIGVAGLYLVYYWALGPGRLVG
jgi:cytochrome c-type biogenesis protein